MKNDCMNKKELLALGVIFVLSVIIRFAVCGDVILTRTYPDELRYYQIAWSIASGNGIKIYNAHTNFSKILYSLLISPAFIVGDTLIWIKLIEFINALLVSLTIPVAYLFSRRIINGTWLRLLACVLCAILPDFVYSMTYMSEVAFLPMATMLLYLMFDLLDTKLELKRNIIRGLFVGVGIYITYLAKEIALVFVILVFVLGVLFAARKNTNMFWVCFITCVSFAICFILAKVTVFRGMGSSYNQTGLEILAQPGRIKFLIYGFFYYLINTLFSGGVLIIVPVLRYKELSNRAKNLLQLCTTLILLSAATVAYTITVREDFEFGLPRAHMRYICYIWPVLVVVLLSLFESLEKSMNALVLEAICVFMLIGVFMFRGAFDASGRDQQMLDLLVRNQEKLLTGYKLLIAAIMAIAALGNKRFRKPALVFAVLLFVVIQLGNNYYGIKHNRKVNKVNEQQMRDVEELSELIGSNKDKTFVVIGDNSMLNKEQNLIDTLLINDNVYVMNCDYFLNGQSEDGLNVMTTEVGSLLPECNFIFGKSVDYVLIKRDSSVWFDKNDYQDMTSENEIVATYYIDGQEVVPHLALVD